MPGWPVSLARSVARVLAVNPAVAGVSDCNCKLYADSTPYYLNIVLKMDVASGSET